jgi:pilus assembly protein CpaC
VPVAGVTFPGGFAGPPNVTLNAAALANPQIQFAILGTDTLFHGFLEALKQESLLKILAEPVVATNSGRPATIHSGGEFPVLVPQGIGTATIQWREFGVRMETVPIVLGNGRVRLDVAAEVSERDFSNSVDVDGFRVPGITSRDVNTGVEMNFGETLMIGGLISSRLTVSNNKVPFIGDVPYLGAFFSRKNYQQAETELVILVTPHLVSPMNACQVPTNGPGLNSDGPTTKEIFFNQHVEVPYFGPDCPEGQFCPPGMIGPGYSMPPMMSPTMPMMGPGPGAMPVSPPAPGPTPYLPGPMPESFEGGVEGAAAWNQRNAPGRAAPALYTTPSRTNPNQPGSARTGAIAPQNSPAASPGLISPGADSTRPTPRFVGSSSTP